MALAAGTTLGPYEILSLIGAGGMGEVYLARDSRLNRKAISSLNPHVCGLYDIGREHDTSIRYLNWTEMDEAVAGKRGKNFETRGGA